jgi:hypothetical protein
MFIPYMYSLGFFALIYFNNLKACNAKRLKLTKQTSIYLLNKIKKKERKMFYSNLYCSSNFYKMFK